MIYSGWNGNRECVWGGEGGVGFERAALTHAVLLRVSESSLGISIAVVEVVAVLVHNLDGKDGVNITRREVVGLEGGEGLLATLDYRSVGANGHSHGGSEKGRELHLAW